MSDSDITYTRRSLAVGGRQCTEFHRVHSTSKLGWWYIAVDEPSTPPGEFDAPWSRSLAEAVRNIGKRIDDAEKAAKAEPSQGMQWNPDASLIDANAELFVNARRTKWERDALVMMLQRYIDWGNAPALPALNGYEGLETLADDANAILAKIGGE